ncbi:MAG: putative toxin-antitoxin system toxin component, PIN family [Desulfococcaceae bacterium]
MRVVLDTNVLVSAFLKPLSKPAKILRLILQGNLEIIINEPIIYEYQEVLTRPKLQLDPFRVQTTLSVIRLTGIRAPALAKTFKLPDENDIPFLEAAVAADADVLITGNSRHFPEALCAGQVVMTPSNFLENFQSAY